MWLKNSRGWKEVEHKVSWQSLPNPKQPITEWVERGVFRFEMGVTTKQAINMQYVAACLDARVIEMPLCNVVGWHRSLRGKGMVSDDHSELGPLVSSCCDLINVKLSVVDEEDVRTSLIQLRPSP